MPSMCHTITELLIIVHRLHSQPQDRAIALYTHVHTFLSEQLTSARSHSLSHTTIYSLSVCIRQQSARSIQFECINQFLNILIRWCDKERHQPISISRSHFALPSIYYYLCTRTHAFGVWVSIFDLIATRHFWFLFTFGFIFVVWFDNLITFGRYVTGCGSGNHLIRIEMIQ